MNHIVRRAIDFHCTSCLCVCYTLYQCFNVARDCSLGSDRDDQIQVHKTERVWWSPNKRRRRRRRRRRWHRCTRCGVNVAVVSTQFHSLPLVFVDPLYTSVAGVSVCVCVNDCKHTTGLIYESMVRHQCVCVCLYVFVCLCKSTNTISVRYWKDWSDTGWGTTKNNDNDDVPRWPECVSIRMIQCAASTTSSSSSSWSNIGYINQIFVYINNCNRICSNKHGNVNVFPPYFI